MHWTLYVVNAIVISFLVALCGHDLLALLVLAVSAVVGARFARGDKWAYPAAIVVICLSAAFWASLGLLFIYVSLAIYGGASHGNLRVTSLEVICLLIIFTVMMLGALVPAVIQIRGILRSRRTTPDQQAETL